MLGDRSDQVDRLLVNTKTLLAALNARGQAIDALLSNIARFSNQVQKLINDNPNLNHVLEQLRTVSDLLRERKQDLADGITKGARNVVQLGETIASGPYFKVQLANLLPYQLLQPYVDAAFKKRGIDPEEFYRNAGLPAFRFPDPNGTRFPNGAPPPAPPVLEGTPDHPGPAIAPGSPCSYTPTADGLPRPGNPLPCVGTDQNLGPFGALAGPLLGMPDVLSVAAEPQRFAADTGNSDRRAAGRATTGPAGHAGAVAAQRATGCPHGELATGRPGCAAVDVRAGLPAGAAGAARARARASGAVHQPRRQWW